MDIEEIKNNKKLRIVLAALIIVFAVAGIYFVLFGGSRGSSNNPETITDESGSFIIEDQSGRRVGQADDVEAVSAVEFQAYSAEYINKKAEKAITCLGDDLRAVDKNNLERNMTSLKEAEISGNEEKMNLAKQYLFSLTQQTNQAYSYVAGSNDAYATEECAAYFNELSLLNSGSSGSGSSGSGSSNQDSSSGSGSTGPGSSGSSSLGSASGYECNIFSMFNGNEVMYVSNEEECDSRKEEAGLNSQKYIDCRVKAEQKYECIQEFHDDSIDELEDMESDASDAYSEVMECYEGYGDDISESESEEILECIEDVGYVDISDSISDLRSDMESCEKKKKKAVEACADQYL